MKSKKHMWFKAVTLFLGATVGSGVAFAKGRKAGDRPFPSQRMVQKLKLTDDQVKQIKSLHEKNKDALTAGREKVSQAREALQTAMKSGASDEEIRKKFSDLQGAKSVAAAAHFDEVLQVRGVLTEEQRKEFRGMMEQRRERGKEFSRRWDKDSDTEE